MASFLSGKTTRYSFDTPFAFIGSLFVCASNALRSSAFKVCVHPKLHEKYGLFSLIHLFMYLIKNSKNQTQPKVQIRWLLGKAYSPLPQETLPAHLSPSPRQARGVQSITSKIGSDRRERQVDGEEEKGEGSEEDASRTTSPITRCGHPAISSPCCT